MDKNTVTKAEIEAIRKARPYAEAVRLTATLMKRLGFLEDLKGDTPLYTVSLETTADALTALIHDQTIVPAELSGDQMAKLLSYLEDSITCDLHIEAHDQIHEWLGIQQELAASAAPQIPPHLYREDQHLEAAFEDRVSGMEC